MICAAPGVLRSRAGLPAAVVHAHHRIRQLRRQNGTKNGTIMMRGILLGLCLLLAAVPARADDKSDREKIVGTWKLVSVVYEDQETKAPTPVYGEHPKGYQIATPEGRWLALVTAEGRKVPQTDEDRAQALRPMISYSGRYRVEGGKVVTKVEVAWNEAWVGGEQTRFIRF